MRGSRLIWCNWQCVLPSFLNALTSLVLCAKQKWMEADLKVTQRPSASCHVEKREFRFANSLCATVVQEAESGSSR